MRARLRLAFVLVMLCSGCGILNHSRVQTVRPGDSHQPLNDDELKFARALAHYSSGLFCLGNLDMSSSNSMIRGIDGAIQHFSTAVESDPSSDRPYSTLAVCYLALKQNDKAIEVLKKACINQPTNVATRIDLAGLLERASRTDEAITCYREAIKLTPASVDLYKNLSLLYLSQKKEKEAFRVLTEASKQVDKPEVISTFCYERGRFYETIRMYDVAMGLYSLAAKFSTKWPEPYIRLASIHMKTDVSKAVNILNGALKAMPGEIDILSTLALIYTVDKQYGKAIDFFQRTEHAFESSGVDSQKTKLSPVFYTTYGSTCERSGKFEKAEEIFEKCIKFYPDSDNALNYLAYMWAERGEKLDKGLEYVNRALELMPENGAYLDTLGWIYFKQKKFDLALEQLRRASETLQNDPTVTEHLGDIYFALNEKKQAILCWKKSFLMDDTNKPLAEKLKKNGVDTDQLIKEMKQASTRPVTESSKLPEKGRTR